MARSKVQPPYSAGRRSSKRKRKQEEGVDNATPAVCEPLVPKPQKSRQHLLTEVVSQVTILNSSLSSSPSDRLAVKHAAYALAELAKNVEEEIISGIVDCGVVPALLKHLKAPELGVNKPYEHVLEQGCVLVLDILALKPRYGKLIAEAGVLPYLTDLLKRHKIIVNSPAFTCLLSSAAHLIAHLADDNVEFRSRVRMEGGIPPLVELLQCDNVELQSAAAMALKYLAIRNNLNKDQILTCNALPSLLQMLGSKDAAIFTHAAQVIGLLAIHSESRTKSIIQAGALQPVMGLLRSCSFKDKVEAAGLIGIFAMSDSDCKVHFAQRGAIQPLVDMLKSPNTLHWEPPAFALSKLAQNTHNQVGIAYNGGIKFLLNILCYKNGSIQRYVASALYYLAHNEENVADIVKFGGVQKLLDGDFISQLTKKIVGDTLKMIEKKMHGQVLKQLLYLMRSEEKTVQRHAVLALAHLCAPGDGKLTFVDNNGLELLLDLLDTRSLKQKRNASMALHSLAVKITHISHVAAPPSLTPEVNFDEQFVNNHTLSDVIFLVEGKRFYAHRSCLLASSDVFRAMLDGVYLEKEATHIKIPNIKCDVFELMMRFIYTGAVDVNPVVASDLLRVADQYLLDGLKRLCELTIIQDISLENVSLMYRLSQSFNAMSLRQACMLFLLEQFDKLHTKPWYKRLMRHIVTDIREFFKNLLINSTGEI